MRHSGRALRPVLFGLVVILLGTPAAAEEEIRLAVGRVDGTATLTGLDLVVEDVVTGDVLLSHQGAVRLGALDNGLTLQGKPQRSARLIVRGHDGVTYAGRTFHGSVEALLQKTHGKAQVLLVHPLPLETYLVGIVSGELPSSWPLEAMKAQAVAARTYAVHQKFHAPDRPYHLDSGVLDQVYGGVQRENVTARAAVAATRGQVLTWHHRPIRAYFHACCGGQTESAQDGWGTAEPYLRATACGYCADCGRFHWTLKVTAAQLAQVLAAKKQDVGAVKDVVVSTQSATGRAAKMTLVGNQGIRVMTAEDLRRFLGYDQLRSRWFTVRREGSTFVFEGKGSGHAVGLCQWGARGMALAGKDHIAILGKYYTGARLMRMY